ncbi:MAG TPA: hypothetical protein VMT00_01960 [Thermoanaerobaculia bacterium]|nr:hypothetical protein [Thermoanaerobaculia bacterium]
MVKITTDIPATLSRQMERLIREGWFPSEEAIVREAIVQFLDAKSFLGDSPRMLHRFAADALNESKPETALKFVDRGISLLTSQGFVDLTLYQSMVELRVQILLVLGRDADARSMLEEARERLPNSPGIAKWLSRLSRRETPA